MTTAVLHRLLAAFPLPPDPSEIETMIAALAAGLAARQQILDELVPPLAVTTDEDRVLVGEIEAREAAWRHALAAAQAAVGEQRVNASKLRSYAGPQANRSVSGRVLRPETTLGRGPPSRGPR